MRYGTESGTSPKAKNEWLKNLKIKNGKMEHFYFKKACNGRLTRCKRLTSKPLRASFPPRTLGDMCYNYIDNG